MRRTGLLSLSAMLVSLGGFSAGSEEREEMQDIEIQGRIACVDEARRETPCSEESTLFALATLDGKRYFFMPEDVRAGIFRDPRIRERELVVRGRLRPRDQIEITKVWSVHNGQRFDIYYFCSVCNIKAHVGGLCWCCQQDFELREEPLN